MNKSEYETFFEEQDKQREKAQKKMSEHARGTATQRPQRGPMVPLTAPALGYDGGDGPAQSSATPPQQPGWGRTAPPAMTSGVTSQVTSETTSQVTSETTSSEATPKVGPTTAQPPEELRLAVWTEASAAALPKISLVRENIISIDEWAKRVRTILKEYWGPRSLMLCALRNLVDIDEVSDKAFDLSAHTVDSFLNFVVTTWKSRYAKAFIKVVLEKKSSETWTQFLARLRAWCAERGMSADNDWLVDQLRANIEPGMDPTISQEDVQAEQWVQTIDTLLSQYNRVHRQAVTNVVTEEEESSEADEEEPVNLVGRRKHRFTANGVPICDHCDGVGHTARRCPKKTYTRQRVQYHGNRGKGRKERSFKHNRLVYSLLDEERDPFVISVVVCGQVLNALLDSGAMENVIDINTLRNIFPGIQLQRFSKQLIGADKKPRSSTKCKMIYYTVVRDGYG